MSSIVEIFELINFIGNGSRPFEEGCKIVISNHILLCGYYNKNNNLNSDHYFALCLQSSLTAYPHEINIEIKNSNNTKKNKCNMFM